MTTSAPPPPPSEGLVHEALLYAGPDEFLDGTLPFVRAGVANGEPVLVAVSADKIELLRSRLGVDADAVTFTDMAALGRNPARILPAWQAFVDEHGDRPVRGIGEPAWPGRARAELDEAVLHETLLNVAFAAKPRWRLRCPYDVEGLPADVVATVSRTHPYVVRGDDVHESADYPGPHPGTVPFDEPLPEPPASAEAVAFGRGPPHRLRDVVRRHGRAAGLDDEALADVLLAVTELATNSMRHGGGGGVLRAWRQAEQLVCEITDRGWIPSPLAGREQPSLHTTGGRGLWLVNQLCDLVQVRSGDGGTVVRLHMSPPAATDGGRPATG